MGRFSTLPDYQPMKSNEPKSLWGRVKIRPLYLYILAFTAGLVSATCVLGFWCLDTIPKIPSFSTTRSTNEAGEISLQMRIANPSSWNP